MNGMNDFTGQYKLSKTLRFELRPIGATIDTFKRLFLANDERRHRDYPEMKKRLDDEHKALLERIFSQDINLDWNGLAKALDEYRAGAKSDNASELKKHLESMQETFRKALVEVFKKDKLYPLLTAATPEKLLKRLKDKHKTSSPEYLETFQRFACYFKGYQEARKNIYSHNAQNTAAAFRKLLTLTNKASKQSVHESCQSRIFQFFCQLDTFIHCGIIRHRIHIKQLIYTCPQNVFHFNRQLILWIFQMCCDDCIKSISSFKRTVKQS